MISRTWRRIVKGTRIVIVSNPAGLVLVCPNGCGILANEPVGVHGHRVIGGRPILGIVKRQEKGLPQFREVPMLICWGEKDFVFDKDFLAEWQRRFPHAEVHRFPDAGHYVLEDAAEEIIELVRSFLKRHPVG